MSGSGSVTTARDALLAALPHLSGRRVVVVGDMLLDAYVYGTAHRLSREAMVPVFEQSRQETQPGGGAFPALGVRAMASAATIIGSIGDDATAADLLRHLHAAGIETAGVITVRDRVTTCKTRFMAEGFFRFPQQVFRMDDLPREPMPAVVGEQLAASVRAITAADAILVSDYRLGIVTPAVIEAVRETATRLGAITTVDAQGDLDPFDGFSLIRNNRAEAAAYLLQPLTTIAEVLDALPRLRARLNAAHIVVSLGDEGLAYTSGDSPPRHIPAEPVDVFDVTGAGDTLIVTLTLALAAGLPLAVAARLGNFAAGVAVRRLGNVTVSLDDLRDAIMEADPELFDGEAGVHG